MVMLRRHLFAVAVALIVSDLAVAQENLPALKNEAVVTGEVVRIGDLVTHAGALGDIAIFRSPDLGHTGSVPVSRVLEAVRRHGLVEVDTRGLTAVSVSRLSRQVPVKEIQERIAAALAGYSGLSDARKLAITFDREARPLQLDVDAGELRVVRASFNPVSSRFDVIFESSISVSAKRVSMHYSGTLMETAEVAVLSRSLARGDVVHASDVTIERRPKATVAGGTLDRLEQVIGLAARRGLQQAQTLRTSDLMKPELVRQNETVLVTYATAGINLSLRAKALDAGAQGDTVNVLNIQSKRTMQGVVTGPGRVTVEATSARVISSNPSTTSSVAASSPPQRIE
jgi:flagella basal body P-ring formation protein FlgA